MIDTAQLRHLIAVPPTIDLSALGFFIVPRYSTTFKTVWVKNASSDSQPRLTWTQTNRGDWLSVEASLPKLLFGRNTVCLREDDIPSSLSKLSAFVTQTVGVEFDAATALLGRVDYFADFPVGGINVGCYLGAAATATLPRFDRNIVNSTVMLKNQSKQILVYDKAREVLSHSQPDPDILKEAEGMLRLEVRHRTAGACKRLTEKHGHARRTALNLLTAAIAIQELTDALSDLGLDREIPKYDGRIDALRDFYSDTLTFCRLVGFLALLERYGEDFWRWNCGGYSRRTYNEHMRMLRRANAWLRSDVALPPLQLPEMAFSRLAA